MADALSPEDRAAKREARRQRELDRIFQLGWDSAAGMPPLTDEQIERVAFILRPSLAALGGSASPRPRARPNNKSMATPLAAVPEAGPRRSVTAEIAANAIAVYTAREVAEILRCSTETVYRWARNGLIGDGPLGGGRFYRFTQKHIDDFLSGGTNTVAGPTAKPKRHPKYSG